MNGTTRRPDFNAVAQAARGRWPDLLPALGVPAAALSRRHGPCPGCGGRDRFRPRCTRWRDIRAWLDELARQDCA